MSGMWVVFDYGKDIEVSFYRISDASFQLAIRKSGLGYSSVIFTFKSIEDAKEFASKIKEAIEKEEGNE